MLQVLLLLTCRRVKFGKCRLYANTINEVIAGFADSPVSLWTIEKGGLTNRPDIFL